MSYFCQANSMKSNTIHTMRANSREEARPKRRSDSERWTAMGVSGKKFSQCAKALRAANTGTSHHSFDATMHKQSATSVHTAVTPTTTRMIRGGITTPVG